MNITGNHVTNKKMSTADYFLLLSTILASFFGFVTGKTTFHDIIKETKLIVFFPV